MRRTLLRSSNTQCSKNPLGSSHASDLKTLSTPTGDGAHCNVSALPERDTPTKSCFHKKNDAAAGNQSSHQRRLIGEGFNLRLRPVGESVVASARADSRRTAWFFEAAAVHHNRGYGGISPHYPILKMACNSMIEEIDEFPLIHKFQDCFSVFFSLQSWQTSPLHGSPHSRQCRTGSASRKPAH